jgi:hypothetical protein
MPLSLRGRTERSLASRPRGARSFRDAGRGGESHEQVYLDISNVSAFDGAQNMDADLCAAAHQLWSSRRWMTVRTGSRARCSNEHRSHRRCYSFHVLSLSPCVFVRTPVFLSRELASPTCPAHRVGRSISSQDRCHSDKRVRSRRPREHDVQIDGARPCFRRIRRRWVGAVT